MKRHGENVSGIICVNLSSDMQMKQPANKKFELLFLCYGGHRIQTALSSIGNVRTFLISDLPQLFLISALSSLVTMSSPER